MVGGQAAQQGLGFGGQAGVNGVQRHVRLHVRFGLRQRGEESVLLRRVHVFDGGGEKLQPARVSAQRGVGAPHPLAVLPEGGRQALTGDLQKVAVGHAPEFEAFARPVRRTPAGGDQKDSLTPGPSPGGRGEHRLQPGGDGGIGHGQRVPVLHAFEVIQKQHETPAELLRQQVEQELGALGVALEARAVKIEFFGVGLVERPFHLELEILPAVLGADAPGKNLPTLLLQVLRQFARQGGLALPAGSRDEQLAGRPCEQGAFALAQFGAASNEARRQADVAQQAQAFFDLHRLRCEVPFDQRGFGARREGGRQAPLPVTQFVRRGGARLAARHVRAFEWLLDGDARGLQGAVHAFGAGEFVAQGARKSNPRLVQHRFAHPDHVRDALRAQSARQPVVEQIGGGFFALAGGEDHQLDIASDKGFRQRLLPDLEPLPRFIFEVERPEFFLAVRLAVKLSVPAQKNHVRVEVPQPALERLEAAVVGHFEPHQPFGDPRQEGVLHLRLFLFHVQPPLFGMHVIGQGSEQQHAQRSLLDGRRVALWRFSPPRQREGGMLAEESQRRMMQNLPRQGLHVRRLALDDDRQDGVARGFARRVKLLIRAERVPQRPTDGF